MPFLACRQQCEYTFTGLFSGDPASPPPLCTPGSRSLLVGAVQGSVGCRAVSPGSTHHLSKVGQLTSPGSTNDAWKAEQLRVGKLSPKLVALGTGGAGCCGCPNRELPRGVAQGAWGRDAPKASCTSPGGTAQAGCREMLPGPRERRRGAGRGPSAPGSSACDPTKGTSRHPPGGFSSPMLGPGRGRRLWTLVQPGQAHWPQGKTDCQVCAAVRVPGRRRPVR